MTLESVEEIRAQGVTVYPHVVEKAQPWCTDCNLPMDICRGHDDALPGDVAAALVAQHSAGWCERLIEELDALIEVAHDSERHARIWDKLTPFLRDDEDMAQLRVAQ